MALTSTAWLEELQAVGVPTYTDPHRAMHALGAVADLSLRSLEIVDRSSWKPDQPRVAGARELLAPARRAPARCSSPPARSCWPSTGSRSPRKRLVRSADEAVAAAEKIGGQVALKVMSYDLPHKTEYGAIRLGLVAPTRCGRGFEEMLAEVGAQGARRPCGQGVLVQEMVPARIELTAGHPSTTRCSGPSWSSGWGAS